MHRRTNQYHRRLGAGATGSAIVGDAVLETSSTGSDMSVKGR